MVHSIRWITIMTLHRQGKINYIHISLLINIYMQYIHSICLSLVSFFWQVFSHEATSEVFNRVKHWLMFTDFQEKDIWSVWISLVNLFKQIKTDGFFSLSKSHYRAHLHLAYISFQKSFSTQQCQRGKETAAVCSILISIFWDLERDFYVLLQFTC